MVTRYRLLTYRHIRLIILYYGYISFYCIVLYLYIYCLVYCTILCCTILYLLYYIVFIVFHIYIYIYCILYTSFVWCTIWSTYTRFFHRLRSVTATTRQETRRRHTTPRWVLSGWIGRNRGICSSAPGHGAHGEVGKGVPQWCERWKKKP